MAGPQQSLARLENKGHGVEPVWSGQLSPDSACSDGSTGSLEHQPDAGQSSTVLFMCDGTVGSDSCFISILPVSDTDSLSQGSSAGSLSLEEEEDSNSLKNHFDTLASSLNDGTKLLTITSL